LGFACAHVVRQPAATFARMEAREHFYCDPLCAPIAAKRYGPRPPGPAVARSRLR
jgi:hypothetical protein